MSFAELQFKALLAECDRSIDIKGLGIDIVPIYKIARFIDRYDRETLTLLFTCDEIDFCQIASDPHQCYAICFATKEAVGKALGTGLVGINWNEIEAKIEHKRLIINLCGKASIQAQKLDIRKLFATWSYLDGHILVNVLAQ